MENYDRTMELVETAQDSAGKSSEQFAKYQDTVEYKLKRLQTVWEEIRTSFLNSDFFKNFIDNFTSGLEKISKTSPVKLLFSASVIAPVIYNFINTFLKTLKSASNNFIAAGKSIADNLGQGLTNGLANIVNKAVVNLTGKIAPSAKDLKKTQKEIDKYSQKTSKAEENKTQATAQKQAAEDNLLLLQENQRNVEEQLAAEQRKNPKSKKKQATHQQRMNNLLSQQTQGQQEIEQATAEVNKYTQAIENSEKEIEEYKQKTKELNEQFSEQNARLQETQAKVKNYSESFSKGFQAIGRSASIGLSTAFATKDIEAGLDSFNAMLTGESVQIGTEFASIVAQAKSAGSGIGEALKLGLGKSLPAIALMVGAFLVTQVAKKVIEFYKETQKNLRPIEERIADAQQELDELKEAQTKLQSTADDSKEAVKAAKDLQKEFNELNVKQGKTADEQERYNELVDQVREQFPQIVTYYDETTKQLTIQNDLWDSIIKKSETVAKQDAQTAYLVEAATIEQDRTLEDLKAEKTQSQIKSMSDVRLGSTIGNGFLGFGDITRDVNIAQFVTDRMSEGETTEEILKALSKAQFRTYDENGQVSASDFDFNEWARTELNIDISNMDEVAYLFNQLQRSIDGTAELLEDYNKKKEEEEKNLTAQEKVNNQVMEAQKRSSLTQELISQTGEDQSVADFLARIGLDKDVTGYVQELSKVAWEDLTIDQQTILESILKSMGKTALDWNSIKEDATQFNIVQQRYNASAIAYFQEQLVLNDEYKKLSEVQRQSIINFTKDTSKYTYKDLISTDTGVAAQFLSNFEVGSEEHKAAEELLQELKNQQKVQIENLAGKTGLSKRNYFDYSATQLEQLNQAVDKMIEQVGDTTTKTFMTEQKEFLSQFSPEVQSALLGIDWSNVTQSNLSTIKDSVIKTLEETMTSAEAEQTWKEYYQLASQAGIADLVIRNQVGVEGFFSNLDEEFKTYNEKIEELNAAREEFYENGVIESTTYLKLVEAGFEDFATTTSKGIELIADKAENFIVDSALQPLNELREQIKLQEQEIDKVNKIRQESVNINYNKLPTLVYNDINKERFDLSNKGPQRLTYSLEEIYAIVKNLNDESREEFLKSSILDPQQIDVISDALANGAETLREYEGGLNNIKKGMEEQDQEVWLKGLIDINEQYEISKDKVEDLKDELAELEEQLKDDEEGVQDALDQIDDANEQLDEANKQLDEANAQLDEAIHGTDDFASSLDGLTNYTTKLKDVNNAIEDIKNSLEDTNDIDEAASLYGSLDYNYDRQTANLQAQNRVIDDALANLRSTMQSNYGDYISFDPSGAAQVDFSYIHMDANDELKKAFEEEYNLYEEYRDKQTEKERLEYRKQALDDYVALQDKVIDILKNQAQEEVDITKDKYDAMSEADSEYLDALEDAINKQRELRDKENEWNELATKEKKLSLLQRDTSGANAKEVAQLEQEVQDDREKLLDESIDNVVDNLKELYEKQKEARDLEIEYMEDVTENAQYFNDWARSIMASWTSTEIMQDWFLQNNPDVQDMSVEKTEQYMNELGDDYKAYAKYAGLLKNDMSSDAEQVANETDFLYNNVSENVSNVGTTTQLAAEVAAQAAVDAANEAIDSAHKALDAANEAIETANQAYEDAKTKMEDTKTKIQETKDALDDAEDESVALHQSAINAMVDATRAGFENVSKYAASTLINWSNLDQSSSADEIYEWAEQNNLTVNGKIVAGAYDSLKEVGYSGVNELERGGTLTAERYQVWINPAHGPSQLMGVYNSEEEAQYQADLFSKNNTAASASVRKDVQVYAKGGLVDYTGPAWVDGKPNRPEAFLNPEDTARIGEAAKILSQLPIFNSQGYTNSSISSNIGDTNIQIHLNIDKISDDYSVDQMIARMKQEIVKVSQPVGSSVILRK